MFNYDLEQIKRDEGFRAKMYKCSEGFNTIGYGTNLDVGLTEEEAEAVLLVRLKNIDKELVDRLPLYFKVSGEIQNILVNMAYNLGVSGLLKFKKTLSALECKDYQTAADEMLDSRWARQVGLRAYRLADRVRQCEK